MSDCKDCVKGESLPAKHGLGCCLVLVGIVAFVVAAAATGCMDTNPASRATTATVTIEIRNYGGTNTVSNSVADVAQASADSAGSTETQTATPTLDVRTQVDARYNDALAAASTTSKGILETLTTAGMNKVLAMMQSGGSGQVTVEKQDGTQAIVTCENGQCTACEVCAKK